MVGINGSTELPMPAALVKMFDLLIVMHQTGRFDYQLRLAHFQNIINLEMRKTFTTTNTFMQRKDDKQCDQIG